MKKVLKIAGICVGYLLTTAVALFCFILLVCLVLVYGPSEDAGKLFVHSCQETSALKFLPYWFLPSDTVDDILGKGKEDTVVKTAPVKEYRAALSYDPADLDDLSEEDKAELAGSQDEVLYGEPYIEEVNADEDILRQVAIGIDEAVTGALDHFGFTKEQFETLRDTRIGNGNGCGSVLVCGIVILIIICVL